MYPIGGDQQACGWTMRNWRDRGSWWGEGKEWCGADLQELFSTRYAMGTVEEICEGWSRNLFDLGWAGPSMKSMVNDRWVSERVDMDLLKWLRRVLLLRHRWITYNGCCIVKKVGWATLFLSFHHRFTSTTWEVTTLHRSTENKSPHIRSKTSPNS